jgi:hypothetical protein
MTHFCYGGSYVHNIHTYYASYIPMARKETISLGYVGKVRKILNLSLFTAQQAFNSFL